MNPVTTGGAEFKIYSSPAIRKKAEQTPPCDNFDLNRDSGKEEDIGSSNILNIPGGASFYPVYTNKKI